MLSEEPAEFDLRNFVRILLRRKWLIISATFVVTAAAVAASLAQTPIYEGRAEVLLRSKASESLFDPNSGAYIDPDRAMQTEIQVLRSRPVLDLVRKKLGNAPLVRASAVGETDVLAVRAESSDPERAALIANTYATSYIELRRSQSVNDLLAAADQIQQKIVDIQSQIDALAQPTTSTTLRGSSPTVPLADADRQRESLQQQQALFRQKLDQLQVDAELKSGGAQLVTPALAPTSPIRPRPARNGVLALVVGMMLGSGAALLRDYLDDALREKEDVELAAAGTPVLGLIPELRKWKDPNEAVLVSLADPHSQAAEAYRALRTSVQFLSLDRSVKIIQMTSPSQAEGKSTSIANLAVALAGAGRRVVLVDADLRRPRLHQFFGLSNAVGFTSVLVGDSTLSKALQSVSSVPGLYLLASGGIPPNPSEILAKDRTAALLADLAGHADIVLIDCPPALPVTDATVLAHRVDATLLVVRSGKTKRAELRRAVELLHQVDAPLVGVVFNGVADNSSYGYGAGYRYSYSASEQSARDRQSPPKKGPAGEALLSRAALEGADQAPRADSSLETAEPSSTAMPQASVAPSRTSLSSSHSPSPSTLLPDSRATTEPGGVGPHESTAALSPLAGDNTAEARRRDAEVAEPTPYETSSLPSRAAARPELLAVVPGDVVDAGDARPSGLDGTAAPVSLRADADLAGQLGEPADTESQALPSTD